MSAPEPGQGQPGEPRPRPHRRAAGEPPPEVVTDPGRAQPYESLYRRPGDPPTGVHRTTPRHYEPSSAPPEDQPPGDTYHWLYRSDEPVEQPAAPVEETRPASRTPDDQQPTDRAALGADEGLPAIPPPAATSEAQAGTGGSVSPDAGAGAEHRSSRRSLVVVLVVLLAAVSLAVGWYVAERQSRTSGAAPAGLPQSRAQPSASGAPSGSSSAGSPVPPTEQRPGDDPAGRADPVRVVGVQVSCQARASTDGGGRRVSYVPEHLTDQDPSTAWRCDGSGKSETLTFSFPAGTRISRLGLVNGYAKVDPATKADRYREYRRITEVRWTFPSGTSFTQDLEDGDESLQTMEIEPQSAERVQLTVTRSTAPGSKATTRDAVLVSEVAFAGASS